MISAARSIWAVASPVERFLLSIIPLTTAWDVLHGNLLDLAVGAVVFVWIILDIRKDLGLSDREGFAEGGVFTGSGLKDDEIAVQLTPPGFYDMRKEDDRG